MKKNDLLARETFERLWLHRYENQKFCALLTYLGISLQQTTLMEDEKYIILYDEQAEEYLILCSSKHPIEEDFLLRKERFKIKKQRFIFLE